MKRRLSTSGDGPASPRNRRRQPQTSCDFCRSKKLKCDRAVPCSNCAVRRQTCYILGKASVPSDQVVGSSAEEDLPDRVRRLEEALFGHARNEKLDTLPPNTNSAWRVSLNGSERPLPPKTRFPLHVARCSKPAWQGLEYGSVNDSLVSDHVDKVTFRVASARYPGGTPHSDASDTTLDVDQAPTHTVLLPRKQDMLALVQDYINDPSHLLHIIHAPSTLALVSDVYTRLSHAQQVRNGEVALMLGIAASSAFLWDGHVDAKYAFDSHEDAAYRSRMWRKAAWDLLDQSLRATSGSLQDVQARMILAELIYNMEGCSPRFRCLQSAALAVGREILLHLIDAPDRHKGEPPGSTEDGVVREIKRRTWWHLVSTDWLLSTMGGPQDRTYIVQPRQMQVNYPRNMTEDDLMACQDAELPPAPLDLAGRPTDMVFFIRRIRLAEISRATVDALPLGGDFDDLPYDKCLDLDNAFEDAFDSLSPVTEKDDVPRRLVIQHHTLNLATHARRARLFRRFLHLPNAASPVANQHEKRFRLACRRSARAVLETAMLLLQDSLNREEFGAEAMVPPNHTSPYAHRSGCIINHLFMACTLLATDPALVAADRSVYSGMDVEETRALLVQSCRLLERVGEASAMAASMVRKLVGVFRQYGIRGTEVEGRYKSAPVAEASQSLGTEQHHQSEQPLTIPGGDAMFFQDSGMAEPDSHPEMDNLGLAEIWDDLMNSSVISTSDRWNELFSDLDMLRASVEI